MMGLLFAVLSLCLHIFSAKELAHDVKEVLLQSQNQDPNVDELLNLLYMDTTTQKFFGYHDRTTAAPPYFVKSEHMMNNSVQLGAEITLHCKVNDLAEHTTVSWMKRHGDKLKLVSVGLEAYSSDPRYSVQFKLPNDWQLKLEGAQQSDEGHYECQVSSHPPIVQPYYLTVIVPEINIADERGHPIKNKYYNSGSTIELQCNVNKIPDARIILWKLGTKVLNYDNSRGGISVKADVTDGGALSRLFIANSHPLDSGNYTCALGDIVQASVSVVVLNGKDGEAPAAMHVGVGTQPSMAPFLFIGGCFISFMNILFSTR